MLEADHLTPKQARPLRPASGISRRPDQSRIDDSQPPATPSKFSPFTLFISPPPFPILRSDGKSLDPGRPAFGGPILTDAAVPRMGGAGNGETI